MMPSASMGSPVPLAEIEGVLAWVDTFKLSRPTKKIHRDFSDAVLLAEILSEHYPKMIEMHNYPPRNSHALKLNNWMTLNRKVLKKLKLNLCCNTMEQLANCTPGIIERVLIMVREKIRRDEELNRSNQDADPLSSGGSYYEACGDDENVLMVPVKTRVNGVLETVQHKVVSHDLYTSMKEQLKDAQEANEMLRQKVDHLDNLMKLKDERITELQKQAERRQKRKDVEVFQSITKFNQEPEPTPVVEKVSHHLLNQRQSLTSMKKHDSKISLKATQSCKDFIEPTEATAGDRQENLNRDFDVERIQSNVFKEIEITEKNMEDAEEFKDSMQVGIMTIEETIQKEIDELTKPVDINNIQGVTLMR